MYWELLKLEAAPSFAQQAAGNSRRWWRNSDRLLKTVMTIGYFDRLGVPRLSLPQLLEAPGADSHAGWCSRDAANLAIPYADQN